MLSGGGKGGLYVGRANERSHAIVHSNDITGSDFKSIESILDRLKACVATGHHMVTRCEAVLTAQVVPTLNIGIGQNDHDVVAQIRLRKPTDGVHQYGSAEQRQKLLGHRGSETGAGATGDYDGVAFHRDGVFCLATKLQKISENGFRRADFGEGR